MRRNPLLFAFLVIALCACGGDDSSPSAPADSDPSTRRYRSTLDSADVPDDESPGDGQAPGSGDPLTELVSGLRSPRDLVFGPTGSGLEDELFVVHFDGVEATWVQAVDSKPVLQRFENSLVGAIAVDIDARKLEMATEFGATHTIDSSQVDPVEAIRALTDGNGVDVAIEAIGLPVTYEQAFYSRDLAGTVVLVGVPNPAMKIELPMIEVFGRGGSLKSSWYGDCLPSRDFPMLIDLYLQGRLDLDRFVSETIDLGDVEEAFAKMERGEVLRSVVVL